MKRHLSKRDFSFIDALGRAILPGDRQQTTKDMEDLISIAVQRDEGKELSDDQRDFVERDIAYIVIPELRKAGKTAKAKDFERMVRIILAFDPDYLDLDD